MNKDTIVYLPMRISQNTTRRPVLMDILNENIREGIEVILSEELKESLLAHWEKEKSNICHVCDGTGYVMYYENMCDDGYLICCPHCEGNGLEK